MKDKVLLGLFGLLCLVLVFIATVGIATKESNKNRVIIDALMTQVNALRSDVEQLNKSNNDTIVVDVKVNPQVIKIYNTCTD